MRKISLVFDDRNIGHIANHHVTPEEVEDVCLARPLVRRGKYGRLAVYGRTFVGRHLLVILAPRGRGRYYVITARDMTDAEKRRFRSRRR